MKMSARQEKVINVSVVDLEEILSTHESDFTNMMKPGGNHGMRDKLWLTKLELLKGKVKNYEEKLPIKIFSYLMRKERLKSWNIWFQHRDR